MERGAWTRGGVYDTVAIAERQWWWLCAPCQGGPDAVGATLCLPLQPHAAWQTTGDGTGGGMTYEAAITTAVQKCIAFGTDALIVSLGLDTLSTDPISVKGASMSYVC